MFPGGYDKAIEEGIILRLNELVDQYALTIKTSTLMTRSKRTLPTRKLAGILVIIDYGPTSVDRYGVRKTGWTIWNE